MAEGNVLAKGAYAATPDQTTGAELVDRPCNLRGVWVTPHASQDIDIFFRNGSVSGTTLMTMQVNASLDVQGFTFPGNGIRFDSALWVQGDDDTTKIKSITAFYQ